MALGAVADTTGPMIHARTRPDLVPTVFSFHELFHLLVIAGRRACNMPSWRSGSCSGLEMPGSTERWGAPIAR